MIAVRIPEEIRKYKEKIMFGLNARQLIASVLAISICVPLYIFGQDYIPEDMSWEEVQRQICEIMSEGRVLSSMKREEVVVNE